MSVLDNIQRQLVHSNTSIDPRIIDHCAAAYDALLADDRDGYSSHMMDALIQQNLPIPTPASERPTALDRVKSICVNLLADQWRCSPQRAAERLERMARGQ